MKYLYHSNMRSDLFWKRIRGAEFLILWYLLGFLQAILIHLIFNFSINKIVCNIYGFKKILLGIDLLLMRADVYVVTWAITTKISSKETILD